MRGEYNLKSMLSFCYIGSTPHAWGILKIFGDHVVMWQDQPHMRGEYDRIRRQPLLITGSTPHAWGILECTVGPRFSGRINPTCVGNTSAVKDADYLQEDQPHMRGEYCTSYSDHVMFGGSTPHAWGIRGLNHFCKFVPRINPTCVGNTLLAVARNRVVWDQPHMRGEYTKKTQLYRDSQISRIPFSINLVANSKVAWASANELWGSSFLMSYSSMTVCSR